MRCGHKGTHGKRKSIVPMRTWKSPTRGSCRRRRLTEVKRLEYEKAKIQLARRAILAPLSGIVSIVHKDEGEFVAPNDPYVVEIVASGSAPGDVLRAQPGSRSIAERRLRSRVYLDGTEQLVKGQVDTIAPVTDAESGTTRVKVRIANREAAICAVANAAPLQLENVSAHGPPPTVRRAAYTRHGMHTAMTSTMSPGSESWVVEAWSQGVEASSANRAASAATNDYAAVQAEFVVRTITQLLQGQDAADACRLLANRLQQFLGCRQVAVGIVRTAAASGAGCEDCRGRALRHALRRYVSAVQDALDEALVRGCPTSWPPTDDTATTCRVGPPETRFAHGCGMCGESATVRSTTTTSSA